MKTSHIFIIVGVIFLIFLGFLAGKHSNNSIPTQTLQTAQTTTNTITMTVQATTPIMMSASDDLLANGVMVAKSHAQISAKLTGSTVERVLVEVGDTVKKGQVLAILDNSTVKENLTQAVADHEQAVANHEKAVLDLKRVEPLLAIDAISHQQVDSYRTAVKQTQAVVKASLARLNTAKNNLNNTQIISPVAGVIAENNAHVGMAVGGGSLFSIIKDGQLEWQATLPPIDAKKIQIGQSAKMMVGDEMVVGHVTHLSPIANSGREIIVHVAMPTHPLLKAGTYQNGQFTLDEHTYPAIPASAVMSTDGYDYVWTLALYDETHQDKSNKPDKPVYQITRTKIHIIKRMGDKVATDLPINTFIVANGVNFLNEGDLVHIVMAEQMGVV